MADQYAEMLGEIAGYYSGKLRQHGLSPQGVDWNGEEGQMLRFAQLCRLFDVGAMPISISDIGCGYGALYDYLRKDYAISRYVGVDVSDAMVAAARERFGDDPVAQFEVADAPGEVCDFCVASGIFNVRQDRDDAEWQRLMEKTVEDMNRVSRRGFAFNCLTSYSDREYMRDCLYYADPLYWFDRCKTLYGRNVALLHDYGLYEFTVIVRKTT